MIIYNINIIWEDKWPPLYNLMSFLHSNAHVNEKIITKVPSSQWFRLCGRVLVYDIHLQYVTIPSWAKLYW